MSMPDNDRNHGDNDAFEGLVLLARAVWGPFLWPLLAANAIGYGWCVYRILS